ncbi:MAG: hypothetical protein R3260_03470 [Pseudomonas sp.]|nr:hypothetical protein [Pseudomonas sp.]
MALQKITVDGPVTVHPNGTVEIKTYTVIKDNGKEISRVPHRKTVEADMSIDAESDFVKTCSASVRTPENAANAIARRDEMVPTLQ